MNSAREYEVLPWWHEPSEPWLGVASPSCQAWREMGSEQESLHPTASASRGTSRHHKHQLCTLEAKPHLFDLRIIVLRGDQ